MTHNIPLGGCSTAPTAYAAADGELMLSIGTIKQPSGHEAIANPSVAFSLPTGYEAVHVHHIADGTDMVIGMRPSGSSHQLYWARRPEPGGSIEPSQLTLIGTFALGEQPRFASAGAMLSFTTASGLCHAVYSDGVYRNLGTLPPFPVLEFGLQRAGSLTFADRYMLPAAMLAAATQQGGNGAGAYLTHPSAEGEAADRDRAAKLMHEALLQAIADQIESKGYWHQPFMLRYALRLTDGTHICPSAPVMMLPTVLPPRLSIAGVDAVEGEESQKVVSLASGAHLYHQLRCRISSTLSGGWTDMVAAVDIYASVPVSTFDTDKPCALGAMRYAQAIAGGNVGHRGRASESDPILHGHWSDSGDRYMPHAVAEASGAVWAVSPNPLMESQLLGEHTYHLIASIPAQSIAQGGYFDISTPCSSPRAIAALPQLTAEECQRQRARRSPRAIAVLGSRLYAGGGTTSMPELQPLQSMTAAHTGAPSAVDTIELRAISRHHGEQHCATAVHAGYASDLHGAFPRYLYYPDLNASHLMLRQGANSWLLPLLPHPDRAGAYWWGGLDLDPEPAMHAGAMPTAITAEVPTGNVVDISSASTPLAYVARRTAGAGQIMAMAAAHRAMSQGQFGQYPAYVFASDGIWALSAEGSKAEAQPVSATVCTSQASPTALPSSVAFASSAGVMMLRGAECECVSAAIAASDATWQRLPGIDSLLQMAGVESTVPLLPSLAECNLGFDGSRQLLWVHQPGRALAWVYSLRSKQWGMAACQLRRTISASLVASADGKVVDLSVPSPSATQALIATRPMKLGRPNAYPWVRSLAACGAYDPKAVGTVIYGSDDTLRWRLLASGRSHRLSTVMQRPCRYHIVAVAATLEPGQAVDAIDIDCMSRASDTPR